MWALVLAGAVPTGAAEMRETTGEGERGSDGPGGNRKLSEVLSVGVGAHGGPLPQRGRMWW